MKLSEKLKTHTATVINKVKKVSFAAFSKTLLMTYNHVYKASLINMILDFFKASFFLVKIYILILPTHISKGKTSKLEHLKVTPKLQ